MDETLPDYTDTFRSRAAAHTRAERKLRGLLADSGLDPDNGSDPYNVIDIITRVEWEGRRLWDIKVSRADGTLWIANNAWLTYVPADIWVVPAEHHTAEPYAVIRAGELRQHVRSALEAGPSGDPGFRFWLAGTNLLRDGEGRYSRLVETGFFQDPTDLVGTLECGGCKKHKPDEEFAVNTTMPGRRYRQVYCRLCDRPVSAGGIRPEKT